MATVSPFWRRGLELEVSAAAKVTRVRNSVRNFMIGWDGFTRWG